jgi:hypothetical protein
MKQRKLARWVLPVVLALLCAGGSAVHAQSGGGYGLTWSTIDGGGTTSSGSGYTLTGTIGQPDAGALTGGGYTLGGGFWTLHWRGSYLPLVVRP